MFKIRTNDFVNNCTITFGNLTLSFSNGRFPNCRNTDNKGTSDNVEVAVLDNDGNFVTKTVWWKIFREELSDDVVGWVDAKQFAQLVAGLAKGV